MLESLLNKVANLKACNFIKKRLHHRCFPVKFAKILRIAILKNICERLSLSNYSLLLSSHIHVGSSFWASGIILAKKKKLFTTMEKRLWHRCSPKNFAKFIRTLSRTPPVDASVYCNVVSTVF